MSEFISIPLNIRREPHLQIECHRGDVEASIDNFLELVVFTPKGRLMQTRISVLNIGIMKGQTSA